MIGGLPVAIPGLFHAGVVIGHPESSCRRFAERLEVSPGSSRRTTGSRACVVLGADVVGLDQVGQGFEVLRLGATVGDHGPKDSVRKPQ